MYTLSIEMHSADGERIGPVVRLQGSWGNLETIKEDAVALFLANRDIKTIGVIKVGEMLVDVYDGEWSSDLWDGEWPY